MLQDIKVMQERFPFVVLRLKCRRVLMFSSLFHADKGNILIINCPEGTYGHFLLIKTDRGIFLPS